MTLFHWTSAGVALFLLVPAAQAEERRGPDPLFQSNEILDVRIVAPISTLLAKRPIDEELPGTFQFTNSEGKSVEFDIRIRTRGKFRRDKGNCNFPPLRLNFVTSETRGTLFHKQDKVKLVTHCKNSSRYKEVLLREFIAYRLLNIMTDVSFRVRLLRITYVNSERKMKDYVNYGFIIEHKDRLAKRIGKSVLDINSTSPGTLSPEYANTISMYHFLIGNTDFSSVKAVEGEACCHNHVLFGNAGEPVWSVPYDFDQAGLVNAPHAAPNPRFGIRTVRQRLYRGRCIHNDFVASTIANYQDMREELLQVVTEIEHEGPRSIKSMTNYIEKFFKILDSDKRIASVLFRKCI